ncbi:MAG: hypothetical protein IJX74_03525, partial [Clostridia bacterium]|nr:hypothetical protein [Clostridia bacterium]
MKRNRSKICRCFALLLAMIMFMSSAAVIAASAEETLYVVQAYSNQNANYSVKADAPIGYHFKVKGAFAAFEVRIPTYNTSQNGLTVSFYKWEKNVETTIAGTPLYAEKLENCPDWAWHKFDLAEIASAGDYFIYLHDPVINENKNAHNIGVYASTDNSKGMGCMYIKGVETKADMAVKLHMTEDISDPFVDLVTFQNVSPDNSDAASDTWEAVGESKIIGQRVKVSAPILGFAFAMPTWGNTNCSADLVAYKWNENFEKTVAGTPIAKVSLTDLKDNATNWLIFEEAQPAGEYLFTVENVKGTRVGVYYKTTNNSGGYSYIDGAEMRNDIGFTVRFENKLTTGQVPFLDCEGHDDRSDGTVTVPEQWVAPEDSLINSHKVQPTTWVFTDGLGRESVQYGDEGVDALNEDKILAMFYWDWHLRANDTTPSTNLQDTFDKYPEAINDYDNEIWGQWNTSNFYWNEPLYGYYATTDEWVLRRHAELLANAGVDVIFTDNSNSIYTFINGYRSMYSEWTKAQELGVNTPKISYHFPFRSASNASEGLWTTEQIESVYSDIYRRGLYQNLWFWFDGKPMLIGNPEHFEDSTDIVYQEISKFFTFRPGVATYKDAELRESAVDRLSQWGWLAKYPQATYYETRKDTNKGNVEQMSVGVAQNFNYVTNSLSASNAGYVVMGRSYTSVKPTTFEDAAKGTSTPWTADTSKYGYNFAEQWEYALEVNPKVVFVTGWNEWTVTRYSSWKGTENSFNDLFNDEYSRDIEPTKGALKDYYYYQLVNYSRKFQGAEAMPVPSHKTTIDLSAGQDQWAAVEPYYAAYIGNTMDRNYYGRV